MKNGQFTMHRTASEIFQISVLIAALFLMAAVTHVFFSHAGSAPPFIGDESGASIAYTISDQGRIGNLVQPLQAPGGAVRTHGFFNYGPWYFMAGAMMKWLFSHSFVALRFLHPIGLFFICLMGFIYLGRYSVAVAGGLTACLMWLFMYNHWPLVRPDIMCSVFAVLTVVAAGIAISREEGKWWGSAAFTAIAAFVSHNIAWTVAASLTIIWALNEISRRSKGRKNDKKWQSPWPSLGWICLGGSVSLLIFLVAIDFRVQDLLNFWQSVSGYYQVRSMGSGAEKPGYWQIMSHHMAYAWGGLQWAKAMVWIVYAAGLAVSVLALRRIDDCKDMVALVMPPTLAGLSYQIWLGFYANPFAGYAILSQVLVLWTGASLLALLMMFLRQRRPAFQKYAEMLVCVLALVLIGHQAGRALTTQNGWQKQASRVVGVDDYVQHIIDPLPVGSSIWGPLMLGLVPQERIEAVQFHQAVWMADYIHQTERKQLAPDFIALGHFELEKVLAQMLQGGESTYGRYRETFPSIYYRHMATVTVSSMFRESRYDLVSLVGGKPYGSTRIYRRTPIHMPAAGIPLVAQYHTDGHQWSNGIKEPLAQEFTPVDPIEVTLLGRRNQMKKTSRLTLGTDFPEGNYLIKLDLGRGRNAQMPVVIVVGAKLKLYATPSLTGLDFPATPCFPWEQYTYLLVEHPGGSLYIGLFDQGETELFSVREIRPVDRIWPQTPFVKGNPLPPFTNWTPFLQSGGKLLNVTENEIAMAGDATKWGYQIASPPIAVSADTDAVLRQRLQVSRGMVGVGILDENSSWLVAPQINQPVIRFNTGSSESITVVFANNDPDPPEDGSMFSSRRGNLALAPDTTTLYVERLARGVEQIRQHGKRESSPSDAAPVSESGGEPHAVR